MFLSPSTVSKHKLFVKAYFIEIVQVLFLNFNAPLLLNSYGFGLWRSLSPFSPLMSLHSCMPYSQPVIGHLWEICCFSLHLSKQTPHTLCHTAFTFHKDRRRLSVAVEHRAKLNIFSLYVSLSSLSDSLKSFFLSLFHLPLCPPPKKTPHLVTDCFFSPPKIPSFSTKLCLFWWGCHR